MNNMFPNWQEVEAELTLRPKVDADKCRNNEKNGETMSKKHKAPPANQTYAENVDRVLKQHLAGCDDPHCTNRFMFRYPFKLVAMLDNRNKKQVFLAPYGGTPYDYQ